MMDAEDIRERKRLERRRLLALRNSLSQRNKAALDAAMADNLLSLEAYGKAGGLLLYASFGGEPSTFAIIRRALADGKRVALPRCRDDSGSMDFFEITSVDGLLPGKYGIPEPPAGAVLADTSRFALCVVPSLAVDEEGYRIGYGRGYYDRFLAGYGGVKAGLCYSFMVHKSLPRESFDVRLDFIVTDRGVKRVEKP